MQAQDIQPALPLRSHTIFGVCEAIGEDFGFNPILLRVPFAASVLWSPVGAMGAFLGLGLVILGSRLMFPKVEAASVEARDTAAPAIVDQSEADRELQLAA